MKKKLSLVAALAVLALPVTISHGTVQADVEDTDGMPSQSSLDVSAATQPNYPSGLWADAKGGVAGRPYVKSLKIINGTTETVMIANGTATTPELTTPGAITVAIAPYNLCKPGQAPAAGQCYASPNRLGMALGYVKQAGQLGNNFSAPVDRGVPVVLAAPMNENTIVDMIINMNTWGSTLRWTWFNGVPLGWNISNLGAPDTDLHLRFKLSTAPSQLCVTQIPVEACDPTQAAKNYSTRPFAPVKMLKGDFILSLDETGVSQELNGALFSSVNADIGSLESIPLNSPKMYLTYGVGGQATLSGAENLGEFYAFIGDQALINYFGVSQDVLNSPDFATSDLMTINRQDGGAQDAPTWTRTDTATFGSAGYLLSVKNIKFTGSAVSAASLRAMAVSQPAKFKMSNKTSTTAKVVKAGANQKVTVTAQTSACKAKTCRWVVSKSAGALAGGTTKLKTVTVKTRTNTVSSVITVKAASKTRLTFVLQVKKGAAWKFVSSRLVIAK